MLKKYEAQWLAIEITCFAFHRVETLKNFDGQKEVIECADFFALSWKLDGIEVSHCLIVLCWVMEICAL